MSLPDIWVRASQDWLDATYGGVSGYVRTPANGITGWPTMFSLTRALQHELGITALSDSFGPTTFANLTSMYPSVSQATQAQNANIVGILQAALWCKGYRGGAKFGVWDSSVSSSVAQLLSDMGVVNISTVTPKIFKSLLTMDAYIRVSGGTDSVRAIQRWFNARYLGRRDFYLIPCDGIYSRQVQQGLMYAIQYETGLSDAVANGNFGPATQQGIRDHGIFSQGTSSGTWQLLYQAALIFNGYTNLVWNGVFDSMTVSQTSAFQSFSQLNVTGTSTFQTWASLLVSTGDVTRSVRACDTDTPLNPSTAAALYSNGYRTIGRYINGREVDGRSKRLAATEPQTIWNAGLRWFPIYQESNSAASDFSYSKGNVQGQRLVIRMRQLGLPPGAIAYLAVDFDATDDDINAVVIPHFQGVHDAFYGQIAFPYKLGVYGTRNVCSKLMSHSLTESSFTSDMSTGYSGNLGFPLPANWAYDQIQTVTNGSGASAINIDRDASSPAASPLVASDVRRTPRSYSGSTVSGYDEAFYWPMAGANALIEHVITSTPNTSFVTPFIANDLILNALQKPNYWGTTLDGLAWDQLVTPPISQNQESQQNADAVANVLSTFESFLGSDPYPLPIDGRLGDVQHFSACTRAWSHFGDAASQSAVALGDVASWGLDLITMWKSYEVARVAAGGVLPVRDWMATNVGVDTASPFGPNDLRADLAAFLCWRRLEASPSSPLDEVLRLMLVAIEDDPGWLSRQFVAERFSNSRSNLVAATKDMMTATWSIAGLGRHHFQGTTRDPGSAGDSSNPPSAIILATELDDAAQGFADAIYNAMDWTER